MLDVPDILLAITSVVNIGLMWFIYERGRDNPINRLFSSFVLFVALWSLTILLFRSVSSVALSLLLIKLSYVAALLLAFFFYRFASIFPRPDLAPPVGKTVAAVLTSLVAAALLLPGVLATAIVSEPWGKTVILEPIAWTLFASAFLALFVGGQLLLLMKIPASRGIERTQLIIIASTVIIAGLFGMYYNLLLPSPAFEDFRYIWTGPLFTFFFAAVITYSIFRYRLFNAQAATAELLAFAVALLLLIRLVLAGVLYERWIDALLLVAVSILGVFLVRSVNREIEQRELIEHQKEEIERASAEKSEFMSFASHEIRNPVTVIRGYASMILEGNMGAVNPGVREAVGKIMITGDQVQSLISQFLNKSKLELGKLTYDKTQFDLRTAVSEVVDGLRPRAEEKSLVLRLAVDGGSSLVLADLTKTKEAIGNIVDNAIKYTRQGSVSVSVAASAGKALVTISDTGVGIAPETLPHLFEKFSRADSAAMNRLGSGIGLYLSKVFVEGQGGRLWAESRGANMGSTFYIELPLP